MRIRSTPVFDGANGIARRPISNITSVYEKYFDYETAAQVCIGEARGERERERERDGGR